MILLLFEIPLNISEDCLEIALLLKLINDPDIGS